jgi:hypothetical protein
MDPLKRLRPLNSGAASRVREQFAAQMLTPYIDLLLCGVVKKLSRGAVVALTGRDDVIRRLLIAI